VDKIVIEAMFGLGPGFKMHDLATNTVATAKALFPAGPHAGVFESNFRKLGILSDEQPSASMRAAPEGTPVSKQ
jgi:hypothetical protein